MKPTFLLYSAAALKNQQADGAKKSGSDGRPPGSEDGRVSEGELLLQVGERAGRHVSVLVQNIRTRFVWRVFVYVCFTRDSGVEAQTAPRRLHTTTATTVGCLRSAGAR